MDAQRDIDPQETQEWLDALEAVLELAGLSIHADCAPVVDLPVPGAHDVIGDRAFGSDPEQAADLAKAAMAGLHAGGVASVIKHIPGHGRSMADSHMELPRVTAGDNELSKDFDAFTRVADAPMAMTAHIAYEAYDPGKAATVSRYMIQEIIRGRIGFDGLLMTDDLGMRALGGSLADRAHASIAAGCDVLLHCSGFLKDPAEILAEMTEVAEVAPVLAGKAAERASVADGIAKHSDPFEPAKAWRRFHELFPQMGAVA